MCSRDRKVGISRTLRPPEQLRERVTPGSVKHGVRLGEGPLALPLPSTWVGVPPLLLLWRSAGALLPLGPSLWGSRSCAVKWGRREGGRGRGAYKQKPARGGHFQTRARDVDESMKNPHNNLSH